MDKMIVCNHKMNMELNDIKKYVDKLKNKQIIVCPTSIYIPYFNGMVCGLQNIYYKNEGAYTGEISPKQAKSLGIEYVILGHSERRTIFKEDNETINKKVKQALENNLKVIFCIGEKDEQKENYQKVLEKQIKEGLKDIKDQVIVAYEPVWSIGTGKIPTNKEIKEVTEYIKSLFNYDVKVLYGGSVNSNNILELNQIKEVSGYLIGGASTKIDEIIKILEVVS